MSQPIIILDFPVDNTIWIQGEGIWLREPHALHPTMDQMQADGYFVDYGPGIPYEVSSGLAGYLQAIASKPEHSDGVPRRIHIMSLVTS